MEEPFLNLDFLQESLADLNSINIFPVSHLPTKSSFHSKSSFSNKAPSFTDSAFYDTFFPSNPSPPTFESFSSSEASIIPTPAPTTTSTPRIHACASCHRSKKTCDRNRPCQRCINRRQAHLCTDRLPGKKRKPPPSPPSAASQPDAFTAQPFFQVIPSTSTPSTPSTSSSASSSASSPNTTSTMTTTTMTLSPRRSITKTEFLSTSVHPTTVHSTEDKVTLTRTRSSDRITWLTGFTGKDKDKDKDEGEKREDGSGGSGSGSGGSGSGSEGGIKLGASDFEVWREVWIQTMEFYKEEITQSPLFEAKKYARIVCRAICKARGNDAMGKSATRMLELYKAKNPYPALPPTSTPSSSVLAHLSENAPPLPLRFGLMADEKIGENYQAAICFECTIVTSGDNHVLLEVGINAEAERLFGYSKHELYNLFKARHKDFLARLIDRSEWKRVIQREVKALIQGETGYRLFITCVNKWQCPIKVLLDSRVEIGAACDRHRMNFFFIPLPSPNESEMYDTV